MVVPPSGIAELAWFLTSLRSSSASAETVKRRPRISLVRILFRDHLGVDNSKVISVFRPLS